MTGNGKRHSNELYRWADQIGAPLWDDLQARPAKDAADCVGCREEKGIFTVPLLGVDYRVDPHKRMIIREKQPDIRVSYQTGIVLLTTLVKSMGVPPSGRMITPQELKGGRLFFTGAHRLATDPLVERFESDPEGLISKGLAIGGERYDAADYAFRLAGLPRVPLYVLMWTGDKEFKSRFLMGIDDRALFHLDLSGVFALTNIMVSRLIA